MSNVTEMPPITITVSRMALLDAIACLKMRRDDEGEAACYREAYGAAYEELAAAYREQERT